MNWQGGSLRASDVELFARADVDASELTILHFYSAEAEQRLARLEAAYAGKPPEAISKTYFRVWMSGEGSQVEVSRQTLR